MWENVHRCMGIETYCLRKFLCWTDLSWHLHSTGPTAEEVVSLTFTSQRIGWFLKADFVKKKKYRELEPVKREGTGQLDAGHWQLITWLHRVNVSIYFCMWVYFNEKWESVLPKSLLHMKAVSEGFLWSWPMLQFPASHWNDTQKCLLHKRSQVRAFHMCR